MELLLALGIMIAVNELKEWRADKRHKEFSHCFESLKSSIIELNLKIKTMTDVLHSVSEKSSDVKVLSKANAEIIQAISSENSEIKTLQENILKELEVNGVQIKKPTQGDYIEGL
jgi:hypothetical protein